LLIKNQLRNVSGITLILESNSAEDALFLILESKPQIIVASNMLPGRNGFELAYLLQKIEFKSYFIILSNNPDNAIDAIRSKVFDYIIYPFHGERLASSVQKAIDESKGQNLLGIKKHPIKEMKIRLSAPNGFLLVDLKRLTYCKADGSYSNLFFTNGKKECSIFNLGKLENILDDYEFVRINRSMIINMKMLKEINEKHECCLIDTGSCVKEFRITKFGMNRLAEKHLL
jgi:two-component system LytT family response regulator